MEENKVEGFNTTSCQDVREVIIMKMVMYWWKDTFEVCGYVSYLDCSVIHMYSFFACQLCLKETLKT